MTLRTRLAKRFLSCWSRPFPRSLENDFDLHENETACRTHFHMKGFALRLVMKRRHKRTRKWPIVVTWVLQEPG